MVLHRNCNTVEGKINNWMRWIPYIDKPEFLKNLIAYYRKDFTKNKIHYTFGKPRRRKRRRKR
jgi:hypothetical protein